MSERRRKIAWDKQLHFFAGVAIAILSALGAGFLQYMNILNVVGVACVITAMPILAGLAKELRDMRQPNNRFDWKDLFATILGGAILFVPAWFIILLR